MTTEQFVEKCDEYLGEVSMSSGTVSWDCQSNWTIHATVNIDANGFIWLCPSNSIKRVKTSFRVEDITEFRYGDCIDYANGDQGHSSCYIIAKDNSFLFFDTYDESISYFLDEHIRDKDDHWLGHDAIKWFTEHPVE